MKSDLEEAMFEFQKLVNDAIDENETMIFNLNIAINALEEIGSRCNDPVWVATNALKQIGAIK